MSRFFCIFILVLFNVYALNSEYYRGGIDTVISFKPGRGQNFGQGSEYFPKNIFGLPDSNATEFIPSSTPEQILSLGLDGEIVVSFKNYVLVDGEGYDFTVFENAFINPLTDKIFAEPAKVAVSQDGVNYIEFPFDSLTLEGCAGTKPTIGNANPFDPLVSGGNAFDLAKLGLEKVKYIKITDICQMVLNNPEHPFYDPIISGFDLDAVVGLHLMAEVPVGIADEQENGERGDEFKIFLRDNSLLVYKNFANGEVNTIEIYNIYGGRVYNALWSDFVEVNIGNYADGIYLIKIVSPQAIICKVINRVANGSYIN